MKELFIIWGISWIVAFILVIILYAVSQTKHFCNYCKQAFIYSRKVRKYKDCPHCNRPLTGMTFFKDIDINEETEKDKVNPFEEFK